MSVPVNFPKAVSGYSLTEVVTAADLNAGAERLEIRLISCFPNLGLPP